MAALTALLDIAAALLLAAVYIARKDDWDG